MLTFFVNFFIFLRPLQLIRRLIHLMSKYNDKNIDLLWHSFLKGDDKSFVIIYQQHIESLLSYGYKLSTDKDLVADCIQDIFIDLYSKKDKVFTSIKNLKAYLFTSLRNNIIKKITRNRKQEIPTDEEYIDHNIFQVEYSHQDQMIEMEVSNEIKNKLHIAVNKLPSRQKEIVYLKFEEELDYKEISEILKISVESSRKLLHRALLSLRKIVNN